MATYDYKKAKKFIQKYSDHIESASLGMIEDWWWTAREVYCDGQFQLNLDDEPEIAGIKGSNWATPVMHVEFKNGNDEYIDCYVGSEPTKEKPEWL